MSKPVELDGGRLFSNSKYRLTYKKDEESNLLVVSYHGIFLGKVKGAIHEPKAK